MFSVITGTPPLIALDVSDSQDIRHASMVHLALMQANVPLKTKMLMKDDRYEGDHGEFVLPSQYAKIASNQLYFAQNEVVFGVLDRGVYVRYGKTWWLATGREVSMVSGPETMDKDQFIFVGAEKVYLLGAQGIPMAREPSILRELQRTEARLKRLNDELVEKLRRLEKEGPMAPPPSPTGPVPKRTVLFEKPGPGLTQLQKEVATLRDTVAQTSTRLGQVTQEHHILENSVDSRLRGLGERITETLGAMSEEGVAGGAAAEISTLVDAIASARENLETVQASLRVLKSVEAQRDQSRSMLQEMGANVRVVDTLAKQAQSNLETARERVTQFNALMQRQESELGRNFQRLDTQISESTTSLATLSTSIRGLRGEHRRKMDALTKNVEFTQKGVTDLNSRLRRDVSNLRRAIKRAFDQMKLRNRAELEKLKKEMLREMVKIRGAPAILPTAAGGPAILPTVVGVPAIIAQEMPSAYKPLAMRMVVIERPNPAIQLAEDLRTVNELLSREPGPEAAAFFAATAPDETVNKYHLRTSIQPGSRLVQQLRAKKWAILNQYAKLLKLHRPQIQEEKQFREGARVNITPTSEKTTTFYDAIQRINHAVVKNENIQLPFAPAKHYAGQKWYVRRESDAKDPSDDGTPKWHDQNTDPSYRVAFPAYVAGVPRARRGRSGPGTLNTISVPGVTSYDNEAYRTTLANMIAKKIRQKLIDDSGTDEHWVILAGSTGTGKTYFWVQFVEEAFAERGALFFIDGVSVDSVETIVYPLRGEIQDPRHVTSLNMIVKHGNADDNPAVWGPRIPRPRRTHTLPRKSESSNVPRPPTVFAFVEHKQWSKELDDLAEGATTNERTYREALTALLTGAQYRLYSGRAPQGEQQDITRNLKDSKTLIRVLQDNRLEIIRRIGEHESTRVHVEKIVTFKGPTNRSFTLHFFISAGAETLEVRRTGTIEQHESKQLFHDASALKVLITGARITGSQLFERAQHVERAVKFDNPLPLREIDESEEPRRALSDATTLHTREEDIKAPDVTIVMTVWPTGWEFRARRGESHSQRYHDWTMDAVGMMGVYMMGESRDTIYEWSREGCTDTEVCAGYLSAWREARGGVLPAATRLMGELIRRMNRALGGRVRWGYRD